MKMFRFILAATVAACSIQGAHAQIDGERIPLLVNPEVTTHIVMPEDIKMVDISTDNIVGNQSAANIVRIKPTKESGQGFLGTITVVGERHIAQFNVFSSANALTANASYFVRNYDMRQYENPDISMTRAEMAKLSWAIFSSQRKFFNIHAKQYGIKIVVNNIYTFNDKFFIDFSIFNRSKIKFDIEDIRIKLTDKRVSKSTNSQTIELSPVYALNDAKSFRRSYRNVIVVDKLTFPDEKVLSLEVSESQISGRTISVPIEYEDILNADCFINK